jgi:inner membrane protein
MDNITHSILGLAAGEAVACARQKRRAPIWIASMLANNIPDIDVPFDSLTMADPLARLLHHRGFTHTLLGAPLQGLLVYFLLRFFYRKQKDFPRREVLLVSLLGPLLHIFADSWNSYGVHPFWPLNNRWFYGDFIFILEPWIWIIFLPALFFATRRLALRFSFAAIALGILVVAWAHPLVPALVAGLLSAAAAALFCAYRFSPSSGKNIACSFAALLCFLGIFSFASHRLARDLPNAGELALSPLPSNPFCWTGISAGYFGSEYRATVMRMAAWPELYPVQQCPDFPHAGATAPMRTLEQSASREKILVGEFVAPKSELDEIAGNCRGKSFLRFARIPFWKKDQAGWLVGDLRFDRSPGSSFAKAHTGENCLAYDPPREGRFLGR